MNASIQRAEPAVTLDDRRELRVVLPTDLHRKLRSLKLLRGVNLGECVTLALEHYFEERPELRRLVASPADA